jgi:regulatory protein
MPRSLKARAIDLLSRREHSRAELRRKLLADPEAHEAEVDALLTDLEQQRWLSEDRYVSSVLHRRSPKLGTARVLAELRQSGVGQQALQQAAAGLKASEFDRARAVWMQRFGQPPSDRRERAKQLRFLAGRGFAPEVCRKVVPAARHAGSHDDLDPE